MHMQLIFSALSDLQQHYDVIVSCAGAQGDRRLGIKGENLDRVYSASAHSVYDLISLTTVL